MARSRTPGPAQTDSGKGYDNQRDPRGAPERPRAAPDQLSQEAHRELEQDEFLMKALTQVRFGWQRQ